MEYLYLIIIIGLPSIFLIIKAFVLKKIFPEMKIKDFIEYVKHSKKVNINVSIFPEKKSNE
ncbi:hypothetical protein GCM10022388_24950 [Flavobacterium chungnamense]|uniref:Uncharacterized protein n=1 Tax=Flavobacterium chungnamense TaxID=706182 RepID=A0ABP7V134_9FLAO